MPLLETSIRTQGDVSKLPFAGVIAVLRLFQVPNPRKAPLVRKFNVKECPACNVNAVDSPNEFKSESIFTR